MTSRHKRLKTRLSWPFYWRIALIYTAQFTGVLIGFPDGASSQKVPSAPKNVDLTQINASSVKVSWEPPEHGGDAAEIMGYYVYKDLHVNGKNINNVRKAVAIVDQNKHYAFINDLEPNSEYAIRVAAFNQYGDGEHSYSKRIVTGGRPPSAPRPQSIRPVKEDKPVEAKVEWLPPKHTYGLPILKYLIWYKPVELNSFEKAEVGPADMSYTLTNLHSGQEYELHIAAVNEIGVSENATEHFFTAAGLPTGEPLNIRYTIFKNHLTILWDPPLWLHRNGNITGYKVVFKSVHGRNSGQIIERNVTSQSVVFEVDSKTSYNFKVAAATVKGQGPYSAILYINSNASTSIGPPRNVRVQALTNSSVVVQWDFDEVANDGFADGFVVKYMHEPSGSSAGPDHYSRATAGSGQDNWRTQTVMDSKARHLEITRLAQKPYAFCVLAIKNSRLGPCSDPPVTLDKLKPTFVVQDLHVQYKTSQSVALHWEYTGSTANTGFYIKQMGMKTYQDQYLEEKTLVSPGFEKKIDGTERYFLWQNLRPYMNHTFQIGVYSLDDGRMYWPRELSVQTDPTGPPFVDTPEFIQSPSPTTAYLRLSCASEEYGPINHYWLIVVPGNYTKEDVVNVDSAQLQRSTSKHRAVTMDNANITGHTGMQKRHNSKTGSKRAFSLRQMSPRQLDGVYITAQISSHQMQRYYRDERTFTLGDGKEYEGYLNAPLDVNIKYQLMTRAFTREDSWRRSSDHPFEFRPPMQEPASRLFTDSMLSAPFSTRSSILTSSTMSRASNIWLVGPAIAIFVILVIVGMLVVWWLRCSRKSFRSLKTHHGSSVTKVALGMANGNGEFNSNGGVPNETSKLLLGMDADGRPVMNAYERPVMNDTHVMNMYPDSNLSHTNLCANNNSSQGQLNNTGFATIGNIHSQHQLSSSNMMLNSSTLAGTQPTPIPLTQFATHIDRLKMNNNALFIQEYESIETGQHFTWANSMLDVNKHKNRYANVVAYDHSRVVLSGDPNDGSDYINANYIDGYEKPRAYIATQGPLPETFADFWRMVWEERSVTIVMLTRLEERSRTKCDQYWPNRGSSVYGNFRVILLDTTELAHYCIRVLRLEDLRTKEHREIQHAQFTAWPDHGVPNHPTPFLMFLKRVKSLNPVDAGPIITHCSAGIGRTGAFIVIDCMLDRLRYELTVDIYGCVKAIRAQRSYMVQTDDQYIFIHDAVLDAAQSGSTEVPSNKLAQHVQVLSLPQRQMDDTTGLEIEFGTLVTLKCSNSKCIAANLTLNANKNRSPNTLPYDANRVELPFHDGQEGSDYINASWIDGYRTRNAYIATQAPLVNTVNDFWRMVWSEECCLIAMLTKLSERGQDKCCEYWPNERREIYNGLIVDCVSEFDMTHYMLREFKITENETGKSRTVRQFQFMEWPDRGVPNTADKFVDYVRQVQQTKTQFGTKGPICVHCSEGAGRTGVFIAVSTIIERIMQEHVVDIFTVVKLLRMQRQNMVDSREQYEFCYAAAIEFLNSYEDN